MSWMLLGIIDSSVFLSVQLYPKYSTDAPELTNISKMQIKKTGSCFASHEYSFSSLVTKDSPFQFYC